MHGRRHRPDKLEDAAAADAKAAKLCGLQTQVLRNHHYRTYTKEALGLSFKLLEMPEAYAAWNYLKVAFQHNLGELSELEAIKSAIDDDLRVNPKSYGAWYHQKWLLIQKLAPVDFKLEFGLLDRLLKVDARNFHGWNYRRFLAKFMGVPEEEELKYTMDKISDNFSNYSAWHNLSILLSILLIQQSKGFESKQKIFSEEFELVTQALFTDPTDQSGWFYHLWLLAQTSSPDNPQLIASWPSNGAKLSLSSARETNDEQNTPSSFSSICCYSLKEGILPIVLFFNEPVKGLTPSSVSLTSDLVVGKNIDIPNTDDIVSRSGSSYNCPVHFMFTFEPNNIDSATEDTDLIHDPISWDCSESLLSHVNPSCIHFNQLKITNALVQEESKWHLERLSDEMDLFRELPDDNRKFAKLTLARLLLACSAIKSRGSSLLERMGYCEEALGLFNDLIYLDPSHESTVYYYLTELFLATCNMETFMKDCSVQVLPNLTPLSHVQLCRLSLTRIGYVERLLWVQMLDLSHNNLRSIEGVAAACMLERQQQSDHTALKPLTEIISLKVLDLSFNEIGTHSINTTRYICPSPFSHKVEACEAFEECQKKNINAEQFWDAILFFKHVNLVQLGVEGNAIASMENFRTLVVTLNPSIKWLDGAC
ncbi:hypothetical protein ABZP36_012768, partial [Zizania latifolia]